MSGNRRMNKKRVTSALIAALLVAQQSMGLGVIASTITAGTGGAGISHSGNTFTLTPGKTSGTNGFSHYSAFDLDKGDVANLDYSNGISTFVNMVDSKININGIVNSVKGSNFYNGHAIFVSPEGMVVGASGVINVGSLGVYAPNKALYDDAVSRGNIDNITSNDNMTNGTITINGKIFTSAPAGDADYSIEMKAKNVTTGVNSGVFAGINATQRAIMTSTEQAAILFDKLVNTSNLKAGSDFVSENGSINIETKDNPVGGGIDISGNVINYGTGNTYIINHEGENGLKINKGATVANYKGILNIQNNYGDLMIGGNVVNKGASGKTFITNNPAEVTYYNTDGNGDVIGSYENTDRNTGLYIEGTANIDTVGETEIVNAGSKGLNIVSGANVTNDGTLLIHNGINASATDLTDEEKTNAATINAGMAALNITGNVTNTNGATTINNYAAGGLMVAEGANVNAQGDLTMYNAQSGTDGLTINGTVTGNGTANVTNDAGAMTIGGSFTNTGASTFQNNGTNLTVTSTGNITNNTGKLTMTNDGSEGFYHNGTIDADGLAMTNNGAGGLNINGKITNAGDGTYTNNKDGFTTGANSNIQNTTGTAAFAQNGTGNMIFAGTVNNNGTTTVTNSANSGKLTIGGSFANNGNTIMTNNGTSFYVTGNVKNTNGNLAMSNANGVFEIASTGSVTNEGAGTTTITNNGADGLLVNGTVTNGTGKLTMHNTGAAGFMVNNNITASGAAELTNSGEKGFKQNAGKITTHGLTIINATTGTDGMDLINVENTGTANITNKAGKMTVGGTFTNTGDATFLNDGTGLEVTGAVTNNATGKLTMTNNGADGFILNKTGSITANGLELNNTGAAGMTLDGTVDNTGDALVNNTAGDMTLNNTFTNRNGNATFTNTGSNLYVNNAVKNTNGNLAMSNANGVFEIASTGSVTNEGAGTTTITNNGADGLLVNGTVTNGTGKLTMHNTGAAGFMVNNNITAGGAAELTNSGEKGFKQNAGKITTHGLTIINATTGTDGMDLINVENTGTANITNKAGKMTVGGTFTNTGDATFLNDGTGLEVTGAVTNNATGKLTMTNNGADGFILNKTGSITANGLELNNTGAAGMTLDGTVDNTGDALVNNTAGDMTLNNTFTNRNGNATFTNTGSNLYVNNAVKNTNGNLAMSNANGVFEIASTGSVTNEGAGTTTITNNGADGLLVNGTVTNGTGKLTMHNTGAAGFMVNNNITAGGNADFINSGANGFNQTTGTISVAGAADFENTAGGLNQSSGAAISTHGLTMHNTGADGMNIKGSVTNVGTANVKNEAGRMYIAKGGKFTNTGNATFTNTGDDLQVDGTITNKDGVLKMSNQNKAFNITGTVENQGAGNTEITNNGANGLNVTGAVKNGTGTLTMTNTGAAGFNTTGSITSGGDATLTNSGAEGFNLATSGRVNGDNNITINNTGSKGVNVKGLVNAKKNVRIDSKNGSVTIGDDKNAGNYVTAGKDIDIVVVDGSILNYGVEKTLLKAGGDLRMDVTNGTIGLGVQQKACTGTNCTGIGPKADGARDFTKSINANIDGTVTATTKDKAATGKDLVINYAAIDSDMNINAIKADGRVILTVDDSNHAYNGGETATGKEGSPRYNMINARTDNTDTNVEGWGLSLIASGSIGSKDNKVTFIQNKAETNSMDALANENIYLKENSFNDADYGRDKEVKTNNVCTMIAREGDMDVEFAGNTKIQNVTAEGDMKIVTRGKTLEIQNLGHIDDPAVNEADYFGPRHDGYEFDGRYDKDDHKSEVLPNNVTLKALDINHNIRPTDELVDGNHEAWANSTVTVHNAVIDKGKMDITADEIYANGIHTTFNKDGFTKNRDNSTNKVQGIDNPDSVNLPVGHAVRPDDVEDTGRNETERNYYYPAGDGDGTFGGQDSNVDDNDNIVDDTPLDIPDKKEDKPDDNPVPPEPTPNPNPVPPPTPDPVTPDGSIAYNQRIDEMNIDTIDKRQYMRFNVSDNTNPVTMERSNNGIDNLLDISRGGIAVTAEDSVKVGDVIPVHIQYGDVDIKANVEVVTKANGRAGAKFVNLDKATANQLLYLSLLLEEKYNITYNPASDIQ